MSLIPYKLDINIHASTSQEVHCKKNKNKGGIIDEAYRKNNGCMYIY